jgi:NAD(P)-dependent dehydrogenase (short-subunit alcohol dehydrogenase family)
LVALRIADQSRVAVVPGDIGSAEVAGDIATAALGFGGPIGVIHNAAVAAPGPMLWDLDPEAADAVLGASLDGAIHLVRRFVPIMRTEGAGCFVFVGSGVADRNMLGMGAYCIAKAAEEHLARQIALEAPELVSFVWRPGVVDTDMQTEARSAPSDVAAPFQGFKDGGRLISAEDAALDLVQRLEGDREALSGTTVSAM